MKKTYGIFAVIQVLFVLFLMMTTTVMMGNMFILWEEIAVAVGYFIALFLVLYLITRFSHLVAVRFVRGEESVFSKIFKEYFMMWTIIICHLFVVIANWVFHSYIVGRGVPEILFGVQGLLCCGLVFFVRKKPNQSLRFRWYYALHVSSYLLLAVSTYFAISSILG